MTRTQITLAAAAAAVVVGLLVLYLSTRSDAGPRPTAKPSADRAAETRPEGPAESGRARPELAEPAVPDKQPARPRRDYIDDNGRMVRDHRRGDPEPILDSRTQPKTEVRKVGPEVVMGFSRALRPIFRECTAEVEAGQFGPDAQVQAELLITIAEGVISVDQVKVRLSEGEDPGLVQCISDAAAALSLPAEGHPDVSEHWLTFPHRLSR